MMTDDRWIIIPDWPRFQSYAASRPAWIKLWTDLNSNEKWAESPLAVRGMLTTIWAEYARSAGRLRVRSVMQLCGKSARSAHITSLVDAGFIELSSSKPQSLRAHARAPLQEAETEAEEEKSSLTAVVAQRATANDDIEFGLGTESMGYALRLAAALRHKDDRTVDVVTSFVGKLPPAAFETVREKIATANGTIGNDAGYAVAELQRMVDEHQYA